MSNKLSENQIYDELFGLGNLSPSHELMIDLVGNEKKVLDVGCASGYFAQRLQQNGCMVDGVEGDTYLAKKAGKIVGRLWEGSLDEVDFLKKLHSDTKKTYQVIVLADVLEHVRRPAEVLEWLAKLLTKDGYFVISTPNIAVWSARKKLFLKGDFTYTESGLMDKTHTHFFTYNSLQVTLAEAGLKTDVFYPSMNSYPFGGTLQKIPLVGHAMDKAYGAWMVKRWPNLSVFHMVLVATRI